MADRDNYRGYGSPSGRYSENREYEQGGGRGEDRNRSYGQDRDRERNQYRDRDEDRGFFERAGEQVRSWFSDEDDRGRDRHNDRDDHRGQSRYQGQDRDRDRGYGYGSMLSGQGGRDRDFRQDAREPWGGGDRERGQQRYGSGYSESGGSRYGATSSRERFGGGSHPHDDHYSEWRSQQLNELDRDYDEYRRENRDKFQNEFSTWRGQRQQQRQSMKQVREHMEVVGSDGQPVGTVDKVAGDKIILTKNGPEAGGHHHSIPCSWIQSVDDRVTINKTAEQAREKWTDEENRRALFESEDRRRDDGPHILDRSFSGTYGS